MPCYKYELFRPTWLISKLYLGEEIKFTTNAKNSVQIVFKTFD